MPLPSLLALRARAETALLFGYAPSVPNGRNASRMHYSRKLRRDGLACFVSCFSRSLRSAATFLRAHGHFGTRRTHPEHRGATNNPSEILLKRRSHFDQHPEEEKGQTNERCVTKFVRCDGGLHVAVGVVARRSLQRVDSNSHASKSCASCG